MVQSAQIGKPLAVAPPPTLRLAGTTQCWGGDPILSIQHWSSAHCGRIAVHWTVQSRVPSRLLSVRGGVRLHWYHQTQAHKRTEKRRKKSTGNKDREEGGRLHLKWNIIRVRRKGGGWRQWGKGLEWLKWFRPFAAAPLDFKFSAATSVIQLICIDVSFYSAVQSWLLFHCTFDMSMVFFFN